MFLFFCCGMCCCFCFVVIVVVSVVIIIISSLVEIWSVIVQIYLLLLFLFLFCCCWWWWWCSCFCLYFTPETFHQKFGQNWVSKWNVAFVVVVVVHVVVVVVVVVVVHVVVVSQTNFWVPLGLWQKEGKGVELNNCVLYFLWCVRCSISLLLMLHITFIHLFNFTMCFDIWQGTALPPAPDTFYTPVQCTN